MINVKLTVYDDEYYILKIDFDDIIHQEFAFKISDISLEDLKKLNGIVIVEINK